MGYGTKGDRQLSTVLHHPKLDAQRQLCGPTPDSIGTLGSCQCKKILNIHTHTYLEIFCDAKNDHLF